MTDQSSISSQRYTAPEWRLARRILVAVVAVVTLIAVFYTIENWRGKQAWESCRRALEAKGEVLDWDQFIPPPVADEQNFYKAPGMQEWFTREPLLGSASSPGAKGNAPSRPFTTSPQNETNLVVAEVKVILPGAVVDSQPAGPVLQLNDPPSQTRAARLLGDAVGPRVSGPKGCVLIARALEQIKPAQMLLQAQNAPSAKELTALFQSVTRGGASGSHWRVNAMGSNTFQVSFSQPVSAAADYIASTEQFTPDLNLVRKALERPYARIDCDYRQPFGITIPNFVVIRNVAQTLAQRAQSHLLLGQPEAAWRELTMVHDLCGILQAKPAGKPLTLVGAMIHVAVMGLYVGIIEDGLRLHAWGEPQLAAIERQLAKTDLLWPVVEAFREERAGVVRTFEITKPRDLAKLFNQGGSPGNWREWLDRSSFIFTLTWMPRGWFYQNMKRGAELQEEWLPCIDMTNRLVLAQKASETMRGTSAKLAHPFPYAMLASRALPNYLKAIQTMARNQVLVDQARVACALERYRLTKGNVPDTLTALTPQYVERIPHDPIGGEAFKYRRNDEGGYVLYSVGWNEKDDRGVVGKSTEEGDWVWAVETNR